MSAAVKIRMPVLCAVLAVCGSVCAFAAWDKAEWGMTAAELITAMKIPVDGVVTTVETTPVTTWANETLTRGVTTERIVAVPGHSEGLQLTSIFLFKDRELEEIWEMTRESVESCDRLEAYLRNRYGGPGATFTFPSGVLDLGWEDSRNNNRILLRRTPGTAACPVQYSPISGAKIRHAWVGNTLR